MRFAAGLCLGLVVGLGGGLLLTICVFGAVQYFRERRRADERRVQAQWDEGADLERRLRAALRTSSGVPRRRDVQ